MLGLLRTTLALMVMTYHLFVGVLPMGTYPVFGFYIISGYLMTLVMHETYGYTWIGRYSFAINRFLRLYPQYWVAALFSILLILTVGSKVVTGFHESIYLPITMKDIFHNLSMIYAAWFPNTINPRLVPPTWTLTVEIFFYTLICLGISKTFTRVKIWLLFSLCYVIASYAVGWSWETRYFPVAAASLPFAIGSIIYFASKNRSVIWQPFRFKHASRILFSLMLLNCLVFVLISQFNISKFAELGSYLNIAICGLLVYSLAIGNEIFKLPRKVDNKIGDYSYPIYLLHWQTGLLVSYLIFGTSFHEFSGRGFITLLGSIVFIVLLSSLFIAGIDRPIQHIRSRIKSNKLLHQAH